MRPHANLDGVGRRARLRGRGTDGVGVAGSGAVGLAEVPVAGGHVVPGHDRLDLRVAQRTVIGTSLVDQAGPVATTGPGAADGELAARRPRCRPRLGAGQITVDV